MVSFSISRMYGQATTFTSALAFPQSTHSRYAGVWGNDSWKSFQSLRGLLRDISDFQISDVNLLD
jgi:hypothetical protein